MENHEGKIIKSDRPEIYYVYGKKRHHVPNPETFNRLFKTWDDITILSDDVVEAIPNGNALSVNSRLIVGKNNGNHFLISDNDKYGLCQKYLELISFQTFDEEYIEEYHEDITPTSTGRSNNGNRTAQWLINNAKEIEKMKTKYQLGAFMNKKEGDVYLCDCAGLIKAIFWGYPGGKYTSNGLPDINANTMISKCNLVTSDFAKIKPGWVVWTDGHIGIYIGDGVVIEATAAWEKKVLRSYCKGCGIPNKNRLHERMWTKCGALSYINY